MCFVILVISIVGLATGGNGYTWIGIAVGGFGTGLLIFNTILQVTLIRRVAETETGRHPEG